MTIYTNTHTLHSEASTQHVALRLNCDYDPNDPSRPCLTYEKRPTEVDGGYGPEIPGCGILHWLEDEIDMTDCIESDDGVELPAYVEVEWNSFDEMWVIKPLTTRSVLADIANFHWRSGAIYGATIGLGDGSNLRGVS